MAHFARYKVVDGDRILKDGHTMFFVDIVADLNRKSHLEEAIIEEQKLTKCLAREITARKELEAQQGSDLAELAHRLEDKDAKIAEIIAENIARLKAVNWPVQDFSDSHQEEKK